MRSAFRSMVAAAVAAVAFFGNVNQSEAAIRVTLTQGANTAVYYSNSNALFTGAVTVGGWNLVLDLASTNFSGAPTGGSLTQSIQVNTGPALGVFSAFAEVIDTVLGFTATQNNGGTYLISTAGDLGLLAAANLAQFTDPSSPPGYQVSQDAATSFTGSAGGGTAQGFGTVNGQTTNSLLNSITMNIESKQIGFAPGAATYTMQQLVTINATTASNGFSVTANTSVMAIPEPATVLSALFGVPVLGYWVRRRRVAKELAA